MITALLHSEVFMPKWVKDIVIAKEKRLKNVYLSKHCEDNLFISNFKHDIDRERLLEIVNSLAIHPVLPFEVEITKEGINYSVTKIVVRTSYNDEKDISIVLRGNMIVTAWLNYKTDEHYTLDEGKYIKSFSEMDK